MNSFRSQQQVKEELLSVLRDDPGNNDRIVALSNELAKLDENYVCLLYTSDAADE